MSFDFHQCMASKICSDFTCYRTALFAFGKTILIVIQHLFSQNLGPPFLIPGKEALFKKVVVI